MEYEFDSEPEFSAEAPMDQISPLRLGEPLEMMLGLVALWSLVIADDEVLMRVVMADRYMS